MTNLPGAPTPAGWFPDPAGSDQLRWWDGAAWTAHLAPRPEPIPAPPPQVEPSAQHGYISPRQDTGDGGGYRNAGYQSGSSYTGAYYGMTIEPAGPERWNTVWVWLIVFMPVVTILMYVIGGAIIGLGGASGASAITISEKLTASGISLIVPLISFAFYLVSAILDRGALRNWGYERPAAPWWILLPTLVYLILRAVRIRAEAGRGGVAPAVWSVVVLFVLTLGGIVAVVAIPAFLGAQGAAQKATFEAQLENGLTATSGHGYALDCPDPVSFTVGSQFSCTAIDDTTKLPHVLTIEVVTGTDGKPMVKLISVTPAITK